MKYAIRRAALAGALVLSLSRLSSAQELTTGDAALDRMVAERMALLADQITLPADTPPIVLQQSLALLDLARGLKPEEFRFARQAADTSLRLGDRDRAIDALNAVRRIEPSDQLAMIQYIDLITSRMETAEAKVAYLNQIVEARGVVPEVQSHAAIQLVELYFARAQDADAQEMLKKSLQLNSLNIAALKTKYRLAANSGVAKDRVFALSELMRASPSDAEAMTMLAQEADAVGAYEDSGILRILALNVNSSRGITPSAEEAFNFVGTQMLAGNNEAVTGVLGQLLEGLKDDGRVYALELLHAQAGEAATSQPSQDMVSIARGVYLAQLAGVSQLLNEPDKKEMPTTNPAVPLPNVRADVARLKASDPQGLSVAYAVALTEQLWFDLYFGAAEVDDANIAALAELLGESDPIVVRLQGWKLLKAGKVDESRVKLEAAADRDGFARLGVIAADEASGNAEKARQEMTELVRQRPTGMFAAYVAIASKRLQVVADPSAQEQEIGTLISSTRKFVVDVLNNPRGYYLLTAQPDKVSYALGEPMIAQVMIVNNGRIPIAIGPGGFIEPDFIIDAQIRTTPPQVFPGVSRGRFTGAVRLKPGQRMTQPVRIDRDQLFRHLQQYAAPLFPITAYVTTNFVSDGQSGFKSGPAGQQTKIGRAFERQSSPLFVESFQKKALEQLVSGNPSERATMAELFASILPALQSQVDNPEAKALADAATQVIDARLKEEPIAEIRTWLQLAFARGDNENAVLLELAASRTMVGQMGAMISARYKEKAFRERVARTVLDTNPVPPVADFAQTLLVQPDLRIEEGSETEVELPQR